MNKNILIFLLAVMVSAGSWAQSEDKTGKDAEQLFENIFPLGLNLGMGYSTWTETGERNGLDFSLSDIWMQKVGLTYDFLQINKFNFQVGLEAIYHKTESFSSLYDDHNPMHHSPEEITKHKGSEAYLSIPLTAEYIGFFNEKTAYAFHLGYEFQLFRPITKEFISERTVEPNGIMKLTQYDNIDSFNHGANIGAGIYHYLGSKLMKFELNYHLHFNKMGYQYLETTDLPGYGNISAKNTWKGNRLEAKVTFYLFNKNSK